MKSLLLGLLWKTGQLVLVPYVRGGFFKRVENLVKFAMDGDETGEAKREKVKVWLRDEYGEITDIIQNLAIELAVARFVLPKKG